MPGLVVALLVLAAVAAPSGAALPVAGKNEDGTAPPAEIKPPTVPRNAAAVSDGTYVYVLAIEGSSDQSFRWDPVSGEKTDVGYRMPAAGTYTTDGRFKTPIVVHDGVIWDLRTDKVRRYNGTTEVLPFGNPMWGSSAAIVGNAAYVFGGLDEGSRASYPGQIYRFDLADPQFAKMPAEAVSRSAFNVVAHADDLVLNGWHGLWRYRPADDKLTPLVSAAWGVGQLGAVVDGLHYSIRHAHGGARLSSYDLTSGAIVSYEETLPYGSYTALFAIKGKLVALSAPVHHEGVYGVRVFTILDPSRLTPVLPDLVPTVTSPALDGVRETAVTRLVVTVEDLAKAHRVPYRMRVYAGDQLLADVDRSPWEQWPWTPQAGARTLRVVVEPEPSVKESNTTNNDRTWKLDILPYCAHPGPDAANMTCALVPSVPYPQPATVTELKIGDDAAVPVAIGFPFAFYGRTYTEANVSDNGVLFFSAPEAVASREAFPSAGPRSAIAGAWGDLQPTHSTARKITHQLSGEPGRRMAVFEWDHIPFCCAGRNHVTFRIVLFESGAVEIDHVRASGVVKGFVAGIDGRGEGGLLLQRGDQYPFPDAPRRVRFAPPEPADAVRNDPVAPSPPPEANSPADGADATPQRAPPPAKTPPPPADSKATPPSDGGGAESTPSSGFAAEPPTSSDAAAGPPRAPPASGSGSASAPTNFGDDRVQMIAGASHEAGGAARQVRGSPLAADARAAIPADEAGAPERLVVPQAWLPVLLAVVAIALAVRRR